MGNDRAVHLLTSGKKDFAASVLTIANVVDPEYLIVEPTGVGSLARIIENLRQIEYERIQLLSPVTIVDVYSYRRYMAEYPELYQDQIRSADTIIVSKTEACQAEEKQRIQKFLQEINPQAKIITDYASTMTREDYRTCCWAADMRKKYRIRRAAKRCRRPSPSKISEWRHRKPVVFSGTDHSRSVWKYHPCKRTVRSRRPVSPI